MLLCERYSDANVLKGMTSKSDVRDVCRHPVMVKKPPIEVKDLSDIALPIHSNPARIYERREGKKMSGNREFLLCSSIFM
ncbi:hypothetical protein NPIL_316561 [Nephila pilipes]|uniref:Uncharacterized protein n=1 Tax=Nephila pilipes TaxID=299642 RepID=A0A8X6QMJ9_NEPPI|nr:hypothetical protein NPIL_316561 [Nephila pilipes]